MTLRWPGDEFGKFDAQFVDGKLNFVNMWMYNGGSMRNALNVDVASTVDSDKALRFLERVRDCLDEVIVQARDAAVPPVKFNEDWFYCGQFADDNTAVYVSGEAALEPDKAYRGRCNSEFTLPYALELLDFPGIRFHLKYFSKGTRK